MKSISILIPVFNEEKTLVTVLEMVSKADTLGLEKELIIVDDGSTDGTREIMAKLDPSLYNAKIYYHEKNQGKGAALRTAQGYATGDLIMIQDADLEYDPKEYPQSLEP